MPTTHVLEALEKYETQGGRIRNATKETVEHVRQLPVKNFDGETIPLGEIAKIKLVKEPSHRIYRYPWTDAQP